MEHEQALANPAAVQMNFKFGADNAPRLPTNLPMMQNQPLHNFTIKNQHLLKLPTVMEASKLTGWDRATCGHSGRHVGHVLNISLVHMQS